MTVVASWSRVGLRQRASHLEVRSTTQWRGCTAKPFCLGAAPTMRTSTPMARLTRSRELARSAKEQAEKDHGWREARSSATRPWLL